MNKKAQLQEGSEFSRIMLYILYSFFGSIFLFVIFIAIFKANLIPTISAMTSNLDGDTASTVTGGIDFTFNMWIIAGLALFLGIIIFGIIYIFKRESENV